MGTKKKSKLLKFLLILVVLIVVLSGLVAWLLLSNLNSLIATVKPQIEKSASDAIGAPVTLGDIEASLFPQLGLRVKELAIAGSANTAGQGLSLKDVMLQIEPMPLLSKRLEISTLRVSKPQLTIIKDAQGAFLSGLPRSSEKSRAKNKDNAGDKEPSEEKPSAVNASGLAIDLKRLEVSDALITFDDKVQNKKYEVNKTSLVTGVNVDATGTQLSNLEISTHVVAPGIEESPLAVTITAPKIELSDDKVQVASFRVQTLGSNFDGSYSLQMKNQRSDISIKADEVALSTLSALEGMFPQIKALALSGTVKPDIKLTAMPGGLPHAEGSVLLSAIGLTSGAFKVSKLGATTTLNLEPSGQASISSSNTTLNVNGADISVDYAATYDQKENSVRLDLKKAGLLGGSVNADLSMNLLEAKPFSLKAQASTLSIEQALAFLAPAQKAKISGTIKSVDCAMNGSLGVNLMQSLSGTTRVALVDGAVKDVNIAGTVLSALKNLPFITQELRGTVPQDKRTTFDDSDTAFDSLTGTFTLSKATLSTKDLVLKSPSYQILADGTVGFDSSVDLDATFIFSKEYSQAFVNAAKDVKKLLNKDGQLVVPLTLTGTAPKIIVLPNIEALIKQAAETGLKEQAGKMLDKLLGGKDKGKSGGGLGDLLGF